MEIIIFRSYKYYKHYITSEIQKITQQTIRHFVYFRLSSFASSDSDIVLKDLGIRGETRAAWVLGHHVLFRPDLDHGVIYWMFLKCTFSAGDSAVVDHMQGIPIFLTARLAALEVADRALLNQCYHPPIGVGRMI